ncbi:MAG: hypothetical protein KAR62_04020 [Sphingomonadales bacterium]|nr:hypothetical protein [Sphingomonadales bacterium]
MGNRIIYMVLAGVALYGWFFVGLHSYYAADVDTISTGYLLAAALVLILGSGSGEGDNPVEVVIGAITGSVSHLISVGAAYVIGRGIYEALNMTEAGYNYMGLVHSLAVVVASGVLISITMACIRNSD